MLSLSSLTAFDSKIALKHHENIESSELFTYRHILNDSVAVKNCVTRILSDGESSETDHIWRQYNVVIALPTHSPALLPAIIGIENSNGISCFIESSSDWPTVGQYLDKFQTNICLCDEHFFYKFQNRAEVVVAERLYLSNRNCFLLQFIAVPLKTKEIPIDNENVGKSSRILFSAMTSGTCDAARVIGVTYKSFWPNVQALSHKYGVCSKDVVFVSSPVTFDPFMIDVALALSNGATLLTVDQCIRLAPKQLLDVLFPVDNRSKSHELKCSIIQTTPSLFMRWTNEEIAERVLSSASSLRILALGGEAFPSIGTVEQWQNWNSDHLKRIFNLYGLTEMSCWASAYEVSSDDVISKRPIAIGNPLDDLTQFELTPEGELLLKTNVRKCFQNAISDEEVLSHGTELTLHTGDVFDKRADNQLVFKCRTNAVVKVFGRKVDLNHLETITGTVENVCQTCAVYETQRRIVIIFVVANAAIETDQMKNNIKNALKAQNVDVVCEILRIERMPLSTHGKISKSKLLQIFNSKFVIGEATASCSDIFLHLLNESLGTSITRVPLENDEESAKRSKTAIDSTFLALGGTSLKAMHILNELERRFRPNTFPRLLPLMLNDAISIGEIIEDIEKSPLLPKENHPANAVIINETAKSRELWSIDMKKCIDAAPSILRAKETTVLSVGSHSKLLYNVRVSDGVLMSSIELPDRIESQVTQYSAHAMVGCYDGYLYCFDIVTGKICWKFNSGGMIKCKVLVINDLAIFGNYSEGDNVWCINAANGLLCWTKRIGTKSIYSNPIRVKANESDFIICTLDGIMSRLHATDGTLKWTIEIDAPFFSTPLLVNAEKKDFIISAGVNGSVGCWDGEKNEIWSHQIDGNIFSSFDCCANDEQKTFVDVIFGSHNHHLYYLAFDTETGMCSERWKFKAAAPIRATPLFFEFRNEKSIFCCSINGDVNIVSCSSGTVTHCFNIDGEIFSSPAIDGNLAFIGSRNNRLYCFDMR